MQTTYDWCLAGDIPEIFTLGHLSIGELVRVDDTVYRIHKHKTNSTQLVQLVLAKADTIQRGN